MRNLNKYTAQVYYYANLLMMPFRLAKIKKKQNSRTYTQHKKYTNWTINAESKMINGEFCRTQKKTDQAKSEEWEEATGR